MRALMHRPAAARTRRLAAAGGLLAAGMIAPPGHGHHAGRGAGPAAPGGPVTYAAAIDPAPGGGTVTFTDQAAPVPGCAAQPVAAGTATCQVAYPGPGAHQITAAYSGDAAFAASTSPVLTQQVSYRIQQLRGPAGPGGSGPGGVVTVELLDASGADVSGPEIPLTVTGLRPRPAPGAAPPGPFAPVNLGLRPGYQLAVGTAGYPPGTYTLTFTAGADPAPHTAVFTVPARPPAASARAVLPVPAPPPATSTPP